MPSDGEKAWSILITDIAWPDLAVEEDVLARTGAELLLASSGEEAELSKLAIDADAIMTCWQRVTPAILDNAPRCKIVARYGIGLDNIAVGHATSLGIIVTNVPDFCLDEVSDHAMALLLAAVRRIVPFDRATESGEWNAVDVRLIPRIRGQVLGLVGFGAIAQRMVPKARAFGMDVLAYTPRLQHGQAPEGVVVTNNLWELLANSDYVSLHAPATPETHHLIDHSALDAMKPTAWLINTSRGALIDEEALIEALRDGVIAGAALDVLEEEPPGASNPLLTMPNVLVTPHVAFGSIASVEELRRKAAERVAEVIQGRVPEFIVNPEVLESAALRATFSVS